MIPAFLSCFCRRVSHCHRAHDSVRRGLALEFRAACCDRTLLRCLFSGEIQIVCSVARAFRFRRSSEFLLRRADVYRSIVGRYLALAMVGVPRILMPESRIAQNLAACFDRRFNALLRHHQRVFLVERSRLRQKFRAVDPGADRRPAPIRRDADLDVLPQLARERFALHTCFRRLHELRPRGAFTCGATYRESLNCSCSRRSNATKSRCSR